MPPHTSRAVGELLQSLLLERDDYRRFWSRHEQRSAGPGVNQAAVARVIAQHLWESGERPDSQRRLPRMLKDRVHRALAGEVISPETLNWFIDAFQMTSEDARRLCGVRANGRFGTEDVNVAAPRTAEAVVNSLRDPQYLPFPQRHQTVSVFERRVIGPDGRPIAHHTIRAIKAGEDGVRSHHCWLMPGVSSVSVRYGGRAAVVREFDGSDAIVDIELTRPLFAGQTTSLQYDFEFGPNCGRSTDYRRVAYARTDNVDLVVQFDPSHPPHRLWWAIWDDHRGGTLLHEEPAVLDGEGSVHWFLRYLENAAVGFRWDW